MLSENGTWESESVDPLTSSQTIHNATMSCAGGWHFLPNMLCFSSDPSTSPSHSHSNSHYVVPLLTRKRRNRNANSVEKIGAQINSAKKKAASALVFEGLFQVRICCLPAIVPFIIGLFISLLPPSIFSFFHLPFN